MDAFAYRDGELFCEETPARAVAAAAGTPVYVYSARTIRDHYRKIARAFAEVSPQISYSVKANSNLAVLRLLKEEGAGFDIVSGGELARVRAVGADPARVVFAGVGKSDEEIRDALAVGVGLFNVESEPELELLSQIARTLGKVADAAIRMNPDVDPKTHRYITTGKRENKFGVDFARARAMIAESERRWPGVRIIGIHAHIGSQITSVAPYREALRRILRFVKGLPERSRITVLNCGGGFAAHYRANEAIPADDFARAIVPGVARSGMRLILEPGRFIVANAGVLLTRVRFVKEVAERTFVICDAGMQTLLRPSLYGAFHRIWPVAGAPPSDVVEGSHAAETLPSGTVRVDVVGPICESGDFLAQDRPLPPVARGDLLAVFSAGAYGFTMASRYNSHPLPPEAMVEGDCFRIVRRRETIDEMLASEGGCE